MAEQKLSLVKRPLIRIRIVWAIQKLTLMMLTANTVDYV